MNTLHILPKWDQETRLYTLVHLWMAWAAILSIPFLYSDLLLGSLLCLAITWNFFRFFDDLFEQEGHWRSLDAWLLGVEPELLE